MIINIKDNFINNIRDKDQNTLLIFFHLKLSISILISTQNESLFIIFNYRLIYLIIRYQYNTKIMHELMILMNMK